MTAPDRSRAARRRVRNARLRAQRRLSRYISLRLAGAEEGGPASFTSWARRGPSARWAGFPMAWCGIEGLHIAAPSRVAVVMHVYYAELVDELLDSLGNLQVGFDLIVTNASGQPLTVPAGRLPFARNVRVLDVPNHGRDLYPLVALVNAELLAPYQLVLKIHTKRSPWRERHALPGTGSQWRSGLLDALLPEPERLKQLLASMAEDPTVGIVTAPGSVLDGDSWGDNQETSAQLVRRLELDLPAQLRFAAGSMYWTRGFVLQGLRGLNLTDADFESESAQVNQTTAHALERVIGVLACEAGMIVTDSSALPRPRDPLAWQAFEVASPQPPPRARVVPFFLPQFHAVEENDRWWGPGFTEWTNVAAAKPVYPGHWQPKLPRELGFYDLGDPAALEAHEALATEHGVSGFMFYHYWFSGRRILEAPLQGRHSRVEGMPFCIMWANENWTRRWDGRSSDLLLAQQYADVPPERFIEAVLPELAHPDYMRVAGRPLLAVYRPAQIPRVADVTAHWRQRTLDEGIGDLHIVAVDVPGSFDGLPGSPSAHGFDGRLGFAPHNLEWWMKHPRAVGADARYVGTVFDYSEMVRADEKRLAQPVPEGSFPGVMTAFDNTARRQYSSDIWFGANPFTFRRWLAAAVDALADRPADERVVFVNAWNEWAEGAILEPSDKFGLSYLQAVRDVLFQAG